MKLALLLLTMFISLNIQAQYSNQNYDWEKDPKAYTPLDTEKNISEITLLRKNINEIVVDANGGIEYALTHRKTFVNNDEAVEKNNKIYINSGESEEIIKNKIRVILPTGKTIEATDKDIKEAEDPETGKKFKYFALDGVVKGSVVEQIIVIKQEPEVSGVFYKIQNSYPTKEAVFEIISPDFLTFDVRVSNAEEKVNTTKTGKTISKKVAFKNLAGIPEEKYSNPEANKATVLYKLSENKAMKKNNMFNYGQFSETINSIINADLKEDEKSIFDAFSSKIQLGKNEEENIRIIEDYVKGNISYEERYGNKNDLKEIIDNKVSGQGGFLKIFSQFFKKNNIDFEPVFTSNRFKIRVDKDFENYAFIDDLLFYFPKYNKYMDGTAMIFRYPLYDPIDAYNNGIFIKKENSNPSYEVKRIPENPLSMETQTIIADFSKSINEPTIHTILSFDGVSATQLQPVSDIVPKENMEAVKLDIAKSYTGIASDAEIHFVNGGFANIGKKPFIIDTKYNGDHHIQKIGNKILFKFGDLIGPQVEMYQEEKRVLPIEIPHKKHYDRTITIIAPEGYSIKNLEKIDNNYEVMVNGKKAAYFTTTHKQDGNKIIIKNSEVYTSVEYPLASYDEYIKVINAAADFNKLNVVFEKN